MERVLRGQPTKVIARCRILQKLARGLLTDLDLTTYIPDEAVDRALSFFTQAITATKPEVWSSYFDHMIAALEFGRRLTDFLTSKGVALNPNKVRLLLSIHEIGRLAAPAEYYVNDFIANRVYALMGIPSQVLRDLPSLERLMKTARTLRMTSKQLQFQTGLTTRQKRIAQTYFASQSPDELVINLADNMGKEGVLTFQAFVDYLKGQEKRYRGSNLATSNKWFIRLRPHGAVLQAYTVEQTIRWLEELGLDYEEFRTGLIDFGPRFVIVIRHGKLHNPQGWLYNRDSITAQEDIMHLNEEGARQMRQAYARVQKSRFEVVKIYSSPQTRAIESSEAFASSGTKPKIVIDDRFDDNYSPGPYLEGMLFPEFNKIGGDCYDQARWGKYNHELPEQVTRRMVEGFLEVARATPLRMASVIISHGDPIAWMLNSLVGNEVPHPQELRKSIYPTKGSSWVIVLNPDNTIFSYYELVDDFATSGEIY